MTGTPAANNAAPDTPPTDASGHAGVSAYAPFRLIASAAHHRLSKKELHDAFGAGWAIESIEPSRIGVEVISGEGPLCTATIPVIERPSRGEFGS